MFKCSECGEEFDKKPDYCGCGNDCFEEILPVKSEKLSEMSLLEKYNISIFALLFFICCLILSALVLFFFASSEPYPIVNTDNPAPLKHSRVKIPDIDTFWNNTPPVSQVREIEPPKIQYTDNVSVKHLSPVVATPPQIKQTIKNKNTETKNSTDVQKLLEAQKKAAEAKRKAAEAKKATDAAKSQAAKKEAFQYKVNLRNALFSRLSPSAIQGSGKCGIQFSVNSDGKLINRAFTFQSENKTLNDEVYKMMMRMPLYSPPPDSYKGEIIKITFEFNNGSYEVHLVD
ncbi:MAG: TonB C-terminal domain-containing protein [Candidatus Gastranaerophilales bacterium]|nr:TonB C-terminal domain-containing protein [Candidatus Gastranaerophilales bacterium]